MITLLILLTFVWMLVLTWTVMELNSIVARWLDGKFHGNGVTRDVH